MEREGERESGSCCGDVRSGFLVVVFELLTFFMFRLQAPCALACGGSSCKWASSTSTFMD